jgi:predicted nucleic acid-binding protein
MSVAYVDTSCLVAVAFGERGSAALAKKLAAFDELVSSNFLECELRSAFKRERVEFEPGVLANVSWLIPDRPLSDEIEKVLEAGYTRGADCWHLAAALYLSPHTGSITFLTLDEMQRKVAGQLGFRV